MASMQGSPVSAINRAFGPPGTQFNRGGVMTPAGAPAAPMIHAFGPGGAVTGTPFTGGAAGAHQGINPPGPAPAFHEQLASAIAQALSRSGAGITGAHQGENFNVPPAIQTGLFLHRLMSNVGGGGAATGGGPIVEGYAPTPATNPQDVMAHTNRPGDMDHALGNDAAGAQLWMQHHPGAMAGGGNVPGWVRAALAQQIGNVGGGASSVAQARAALLAAMRGGRGTPPPSGRPAASY